jgi:hypothetical protein
LNLNFKAKLIGTGVRVSCLEKGAEVGPPAESEFRTFQSMFDFVKKTLSSLSTVKNRLLAVFLIDDRDMHNIQEDKSRGYSCMILYIQYSIIQF